MASPFVGEIFTFVNPDGSEVTLRGWGNQFEAVFETLDGYTVVKGEDGYYEYARLSDDGESLVPAARGSVRQVPRRRPSRNTCASPARPPARGRDGPRRDLGTVPRWMERRQEDRARRIAQPPEGLPPEGCGPRAPGRCTPVDHDDRRLPRPRASGRLLGLPADDRPAGGRRLLQQARLLRLREQRLGLRLLPGCLRRQASIQEPRRRLLPGRPPADLLHRPGDRVRYAGPGADPRGTGRPRRGRVRLLRSDGRLRRLHPGTQRLLRRRSVQRLVRRACGRTRGAWPAPMPSGVDAGSATTRSPISATS